MSKINLTPNASGTGTLTVTSPNTNSDYTLTLPAVTGTFNTSGGVNEVPAGSASAPSITFTGDTNTGIYSPGADTIAFTEGGAEAMRIDSSGRVSIGTSSTVARLQSSNAAATATPTGGSAAGSGFYITNTDTAYGMMFGNSGNGDGWIQQQRSDSTNTQYNLLLQPIGGNVGIGTSSPGNNRLHVRGTTSEPLIRAISVSPTGNGIYGQYNAKYDGTASDWYFGQASGGEFGFWNNTGSVSERMRITSGGDLLVGTTASSGKLTCVTSAVQISGYFQSNTTTAGYHGVYGESQKSYGVYGRTYDNAYGGVIGFDSANTTFGILGYAGYGLYTNASINVNGTIYTSDGRLKENVKPITNALDKITKLNPVSFDWKAASSKGVANKNAPFPDYGMIAQEVEQILPDIVYETKVPARPKETEGLKTLEDDLGSYKGVDYSRLIPFLTKAIQELKAELDEAKARIAVLEVK